MGFNWILAGVLQAVSEGLFAQANQLWHALKRVQPMRELIECAFRSNT
jgi:hypothetical protein